MEKFNGAGGSIFRKDLRTLEESTNPSPSAQQTRLPETTVVRRDIPGDSAASDSQPASDTGLAGLVQYYLGMEPQASESMCSIPMQPAVLGQLLDDGIEHVLLRPGERKVLEDALKENAVRLLCKLGDQAQYDTLMSKCRKRDLKLAIATHVMQYPLLPATAREHLFARLVQDLLPRGRERPAVEDVAPIAKAMTDAGIKQPELWQSFMDKAMPKGDERTTQSSSFASAPDPQRLAWLAMAEALHEHDLGAFIPLCPDLPEAWRIVLEKFEGKWYWDTDVLKAASKATAFPSDARCRELFAGLIGAECDELLAEERLGSLVHLAGTSGTDLSLDSGAAALMRHVPRVVLAKLNEIPATSSWTSKVEPRDLVETAARLLEAAPGDDECRKLFCDLTGKVGGTVLQVAGAKDLLKFLEDARVHLKVQPEGLMPTMGQMLALTLGHLRRYGGGHVLPQEIHDIARALVGKGLPASDWTLVLRSFRSHAGSMANTLLSMEEVLGKDAGLDLAVDSYDNSLDEAMKIVRWTLRFKALDLVPLAVSLLEQYPDRERIDELLHMLRDESGDAAMSSQMRLRAIVDRLELGQRTRS